MENKDIQIKSKSINNTTTFTKNRSEWFKTVLYSITVLAFVCGAFLLLLPTLSSNVKWLDIKYDKNVLISIYLSGTFLLIISSTELMLNPILTFRNNTNWTKRLSKNYMKYCWSIIIFNISTAFMFWWGIFIIIYTWGMPKNSPWYNTINLAIYPNEEWEIILMIGVCLVMLLSFINIKVIKVQSSTIYELSSTTQGIKLFGLKDDEIAKFYHFRKSKFFILILVGIWLLPLMIIIYLFRRKRKRANI